MTRHAELEADSPKPDSRGLQHEKGRAAYGGLRTLTSLELPDAGPASGVAHAPPDAVRPTRPRQEGRLAGPKCGASGLAKGDSVVPFRLPTNCIWTVVDTYQVDGAQYVVVRRDEAPRAAPRALSRRESQAVALAARGHTNKVIAFEMGASASTVGVLLYRAAQKLGSRTRAELLACFLGLAANEVSPGTHSCSSP